MLFSFCTEDSSIWRTSFSAKDSSRRFRTRSNSSRFEEFWIMGINQHVKISATTYSGHTANHARQNQEQELTTKFQYVAIMILVHRNAYLLHTKFPSSCLKLLNCLCMTLSKGLQFWKCPVGFIFTSACLVLQFLYLTHLYMSPIITGINTHTYQARFYTTRQQGKWW